MNFQSPACFEEGLCIQINFVVSRGQYSGNKIESVCDQLAIKLGLFVLIL